MENIFTSEYLTTYSHKANPNVGRSHKQWPRRPKLAIPCSIDSWVKMSEKVAALANCIIQRLWTDLIL